MTAVPPTAGTVAAALPLDERVAAFATEVVRPLAPEMARGGVRHAGELIAEAGRRGIAGLLTPAAFGGQDAGHVAFARAVEAVARECASSAVIYDVHVSVASEPFALFGEEEQKRRYLSRLATGEWLGAFALSEAGSGSDAASLTTRAVRDGDGYVLDGTKMWITNAGEADLYLVMARTGAPGARGISAFLVEAAWPGVRTSRPLRKLGLRGSSTAELVLDSVRVPAANRVGAEGTGFRLAMAALDSGRIGISAQATGIAQGALEAAVDHLRRLGLDLPDAALLDEGAAAAAPAAASRLAGMAAQVAAARAVTLHAAALCDEGVPFTREAAVAKLVSTDACVAVAHAAVEICAPHSRADGHPAAVRLRDAKACQIYEGTNQIQRLVIARELLRG
ncbi:MAG: acyl-CoA dehydrogenase domain protein [Chloroflexi bacterium]|jgi:alkylation response protein AidB-like acyl-CoA dehydrogenase|nr:acyl-CoA dehydrogenase domain protein [Chloroflexota bacterium]